MKLVNTVSTEDCIKLVDTGATEDWMELVDIVCTKASEVAEQPAKKRSRPKGSKNKAKSNPTKPTQNVRERAEKAADLKPNRSILRLWWYLWDLQLSSEPCYQKEETKNWM